jgi:hypothetical protein
MITSHRKIPSRAINNEAESLLDAEAKLGELLVSIEPKYVGSIPGTHEKRNINKEVLKIWIKSMVRL